MILIDTNVIVDVLGAADTPTAAWSRTAYERAAEQASLGCNHVVLAEVAAGAAYPKELLSDLDRLQIELIAYTDAAAFLAAKAFAVYRARGGRREAILADFLIAGHAEALGASLMTRDRRLGRYFPDVTLITPETHP